MADPGGIIASDGGLTGAQRQALRGLVGIMIPADAGYAVPGADDDAIFPGIAALAARDVDATAAGLDALDALARARHGSAFVELAAAEREAVALAFADAGGAFARALVSMTVQCYYRDPRVMVALGMEPRPPFPQGYVVEQGDWSLLDPVRARPKLWRDAPP
jgi:hypothetical protein